MHNLKKIWNHNPLLAIMLIAFIARMISVIFAKGFGMHDDHFIVVDPPFSWTKGGDNNYMLPGSDENATPGGQSFTYVGIQYIYFEIITFLKITSPQAMMFFNRLLHALFSLITVFCGYKITRKLSGVKEAGIVGLLLAIYWFMPWMSVRNLVELVCIPFLVSAIWLIISAGDRKRYYITFFLAGILLGMSLSIRYQTMIIVGGTGLVLLVQKKWKETALLAMGSLLLIIFTQGLTDYLIWEKPFGQLIAYTKYNLSHARDYIIGPWYMYVTLLLGILIPPVSVFLFFGYFYKWRKLLIIFLPSFLFLIFHSYFPNKQERFIIPIIPFLIIAGTIGWYEFISKSKFWIKRMRLHRAAWTFFWVLNIIILPVVSTMYSKKARVESMVYLTKYKNIEYMLFDDVYRGDVKIPPLFYYGEYVGVFRHCGDHPFDSLVNQLEIYGPNKIPRFVLFFDVKSLDKRVEKIKEVLPNIEYETTIEPGFVDMLLHKMNPINANQTITIYRNKDFFPEPIPD